MEKKIEPETVLIECIADYPDGLYKKGERLTVYRSSGKAYLLREGADGEDSVFDYPNLFKEVAKPLPSSSPDSERPKTLEELAQFEKDTAGLNKPLVYVFNPLCKISPSLASE